MKQRPTPPRKPIPVSPEGEPYPMSEPLRDETLSSVMRGFSTGEVMLKVYKIQGQEKEYCCYMENPDNLTEQTIADLGYGSGKYVLHILIDGEFKTAYTMRIATKPQDAQAGSGESTITKLLLERLAALENRLLSAPAQQREPINDLADALVKLNQLNGAQREQPREVPVETIMRAIELGKTLNGADDSAMGIFKEIAREAGPPLIQAFVQSRQQQQQQGQQMEPPRIPALNPEQLREAQLKEGLAYLKKKCLSGADPGLFTDWIIGNVEDPDYGFLVHKVISETFETFSGHDPEIATPPFVEFFRAIYDGLRSAFSPSNPVVTDTGGTGGHKSNPASNGKSIKGGSAKP